MADNPKVREILDEVSELPADQRAEFLDRACDGDEALRAEVESLLRSLEGADDFLIDPVPEKDAGTGAVNGRIGPYRLLERIGEGGMGAVYLAQQERPVQRRVALKIIKPGMDSAGVIARFESERQALALMDHSNIARVYDAGTTTSGRPYFVMELVRGLPITRHCDENRLTPQQRLELFIPVCRAVQHAHQKGIIHRDLKPANVLVSVEDGQQVVKVIDFGIAKAMDQQAAERTAFTQFGMMVGTPEYMSPEQASGKPLETDTRSDIYALGVILYELLTGVTPLDREKMLQAGYEQMMRTIREVDPPRPSTRLSLPGEKFASASALRSMDPRQLSRLLNGDLDVITMKCLEKDRARRYETASSLARDLERYLNDDPIEARPPSQMYLIRKLAWKYRRALSVAAMLLLIFTLFLATTSVVFWVLRDRAVIQRDIAEKATAAEGVAKDKAEHQTYVASVYAASAAVSFENISDADGFLDKAPNQLRNWEWRYIHAAADLQQSSFPFTATLDSHGMLARMVDAESIQFIDWRSKRIIRTIPKLPGPQNHLMAVSFDETQAVAVNPESKWGSVGMQPVIIKLDTSQQVPLKLTHPQFFRKECLFYYYVWKFNPQGTLMVTTSWDNSVRFWDTSSGEYLFNLIGHKCLVIDAKFSRDGRRLVTGDINGVSKVWDVDTKSCIATYRNREGGWISSSLSPDASRVVSAVSSQRGAGVIWNLDPHAANGVGRVLELNDAGHINYGIACQLSPDGKLVAIGGGPMMASVFDSENGRVINTMRGHTNAVTGVQFSQDGKQLLTGSYDQTTRVWSVKPPPPHPQVFGSSEQPIKSANFTADSHSLVVYTPDGTAQCFDIETGELRATLNGKALRPPSQGISASHLSSMVTHVAVPAIDGQVFVCDAVTGTAEALIGDRFPGIEVTQTAFTHDGLRAITSSNTGTYRVWDLTTAKAIATLQAFGNSASRIVVSPSDECVATNDGSDQILLWDIRPNRLRAPGLQQPLCRLQHPARDGAPIESFAFSNDSTRIVTGSRDRTAVVWDISSPLKAAAPTTAPAARIARFVVNHSTVESVAFNKDGSRVVESDTDNIAEVWSVSPARQLFFLRGHQGSLLDACYSPDGTRILTASRDNTARIWDAESGQELLDLRGHTAPVRSAVFSPDGTKVLTVSDDGTARVWDSVSQEQRQNQQIKP